MQHSIHIKEDEPVMRVGEERNRGGKRRGVEEGRGGDGRVVEEGRGGRGGEEEGANTKGWVGGTLQRPSGHVCSI